MKNQILSLFLVENVDLKTKHHKINVLKEYLVILVRIWFKYTTVYLKIVEEKNMQTTINPEFNTFPSVSSDEEAKISPFRRSTRRLLTFPKGDLETNENPTNFINYLEFLKRFDIRAIKKLNFKFEVEEFMRFLFETLLSEAVLLKNQWKIKEAFVVANFAWNHSKFFENTAVK